MNVWMQTVGDKVLIRLGRGHWLGNGRMLRGPLGDTLEKIPGIKFWNNALNAAPGWKWMLSIVPLMGAIKGEPAVEKLDLNQTTALAATGMVFGTYALLVYPRAWLLFSCNAALLSVHGYNLGRIYNYKKEQAESK